jgi:hypothetical protein
MPFSLREIRRIVESSPAFKLVRGEWPAEDIVFLDHAFRGIGNVVVPESELRTLLERWMETLFQNDQDHHPGWRPADRIAHYVRHELLRKREPADRLEAVYELTSDAERFLSWIEDQRRRDFVGTEYGLQSIMRDLRELSARATGDWQKRIDVLRTQRDAIDKEMSDLLSGKQDERADVRYVMEHLRRLERASQDLVGDFSMLRERFAELAKDIAREHGSISTRRGDVLRLALDGEDALRTTPMGESFYGFWRLVASSEREEFMAMLDAIYSTPELPEEMRERRSLESFIDALRDQGQVVLDANRQLTRQLRRALDREDIETRRLMTARMGELRVLLLGHIEDLDDTVGISVETPLDFCLPMDRPLYEPSEPVVVETALKTSSAADMLRAAEQIAEAGIINFKRLTKNIEICLTDGKHGTGVLLSTVVERFPPEEGILDLLGYLHLGRLLGENAQVMEQTFSWEARVGREVFCPDVFYISTTSLTP